MRFKLYIIVYIVSAATHLQRLKAGTNTEQCIQLGRYLAYKIQDQKADTEAASVDNSRC